MTMGGYLYLGPRTKLSTAVLARRAAWRVVRDVCAGQYNLNTDSVCQLMHRSVVQLGQQRFKSTGKAFSVT